MQRLQRDWLHMPSNFQDYIFTKNICASYGGAFLFLVVPRAPFHKPRIQQQMLKARNK